MYEMTVSNPTCRWVIIAAGFKFWAGLAIGNYMPQYFGKVYAGSADVDLNKKNKNIYNIGNSFVVSLCGFLSAYFGGYISDRLGKQGYVRIQSTVCIFSSVLGIPTILLCCLL